MSRRDAALVVLAIAGILAATTFPTSSSETGHVGFCLVCGERGVSDAFLNLLLFAPLGAALALLGWRVHRIVIGACLLSALV
jgi:hypothetical protein